MPPATEISAAVADGARRDALRAVRRFSGFTIIPRLETYPRVVAFVQTLPGRLMLVGLFTGVLVLFSPAFWAQIGSAPLSWDVRLMVIAMPPSIWAQTGILLALISLLPERRSLFLVLASLCWIYLLPPFEENLLRGPARVHGAADFMFAWPAVVVAVIVGGGVYAWLVRRFPASPWGRRPALGLVLLLCLLLAATALPLRGAGYFLIAASAMVLGKYVWFFAYAVSGASAREPLPWWKQIGVFRPFWGFSNVPYAKGAAYLQRVEAKDPAQFAVAQLKGLKLLVWALILYAMAEILNRLVLRAPGPISRGFPWGFPGLIPTVAEAMSRQLQGRPFPLPMRWLALVLEFLRSIARLTYVGHVIIAICRMAGFNAARNTYRPLTATTIAEFYNRLYYYFKELLVDFFFYPTFFRYFKRFPRLRLFAATLAAAGLGNFLYHFLRDDGYIFQLGFWPALKSFNVYGVYAIILGTAIGLSQLRARARGPHKIAGARKVLAIGGVLTFYCLLMILDVDLEGVDRSRTLIERGAYFLSLFRP